MPPGLPGPYIKFKNGRKVQKLENSIFSYIFVYSRYTALAAVMLGTRYALLGTQVRPPRYDQAHGPVFFVLLSLASFALLSFP